MKTFRKTAAQGDILITRIERLPEKVVLVPTAGPRVVIAHSETGHHHVMTAERTRVYTLPDSIMDLFLEVSEPDTLEHLRLFDTHEPIQVEPGYYHVRRQRERAYTPEGLRRVED